MNLAHFNTNNIASLILKLDFLHFSQVSSKKCPFFTFLCLVMEFKLLYPLFSLEKKGILISCQSRFVVRPSVCPSVRPCVCPSVTFLVNVSPPKP